MINLEPLNQEVKCNCIGSKHIPLPLTYYKVVICDEEIWLCPTSYCNYQRLLTDTRQTGRLLPGSITKHYSRYIRDLVRKTWDEERRSDL